MVCRAPHLGKQQVQARYQWELELATRTSGGRLCREVTGGNAADTLQIRFDFNQRANTLSPASATSPPGKRNVSKQEVSRNIGEERWGGI